MPIPVKYTPEIQLGHLIQAALAVMTVSGWALWGYATIEAQLATQDKAVGLVSQRLDQDEANAKQDRSDERARDDRIATSLDHITDQLGDLRALVAAKTDNATRR